MFKCHQQGSHRGFWIPSIRWLLRALSELPSFFSHNIQIAYFVKRTYLKFGWLLTFLVDHGEFPLGPSSTIPVEKARSQDHYHGSMLQHPRRCPIRLRWHYWSSSFPVENFAQHMMAEALLTSECLILLIRFLGIKWIEKVREWLNLVSLGAILSGRRAPSNRNIS